MRMKASQHVVSTSGSSFPESFDAFPKKTSALDTIHRVSSASSQATSRASSSYPSEGDEESLELISERNEGETLEDRRWGRRNDLTSPRRRRYRLSRAFRGKRAKFMWRSLSSYMPTSKLAFVAIVVLCTVGALATATVFLVRSAINPDKAPLPWRAYCSLATPYNHPSYSTLLEHLSVPEGRQLLIKNVTSATPLFSQSLSMEILDQAPPVGLFLGIFSTDSALERRMLVRSTWASHPRSRYGAGIGDNGVGTSRTVVRFIMGRPRQHWQRRVQLEAETYNDIIILPISENMNAGKTFSFFSWAAENAWVPSPNTTENPYSDQFSYSNESILHRQRSASHDPPLSKLTWVRPDFVVKVDDDSFVMLAELEARLRYELYASQSEEFVLRRQSSVEFSTPNPITEDDAVLQKAQVQLIPHSNPSYDPLVYWGYLVRNKFMAGELYALSWPLVQWINQNAVVKRYIKGKEDQLVAKWMLLHPEASAIRWRSEPCWIYDHPKANTVYSHGFLFPAEVTRVKKNVIDTLHLMQMSGLISHKLLSTPSSWAHSSVTTFGTRYDPPIHNFTLEQSVEALVEGSGMSLLGQSSDFSPDRAWDLREGRLEKYQGRRVGGTVVVHFIKKNSWFLETALALLEGEDVI